MVVLIYTKSLVNCARSKKITCLIHLCHLYLFNMLPTLSLFFLQLINLNCFFLFKHYNFCDNKNLPRDCLLIIYD